MEWLPWVLTTLSTFIAVKKEWIVSKFTKGDKMLEQAASIESVEAAQLGNVQSEIKIYQDMLTDITERHKGMVDELREEIKELKSLIEEQKEYIKKQQRSLKYYQDKYGDGLHEDGHS